MAFTPFSPGSTPQTTDATKLVLSGVTKILFTPYVLSQGAYSLGSTTYQLDNIIADSAAITQDDPEENTIECETRDEPILKTVKNGAFNIEMTSADIQKDILINMFGYTEDTTNHYIYAPASYKEVYAAVEFIFGAAGAEKASLVCPKVQLSSKIDASSLKSETVKGQITGTCISVAPAAGVSYKTPFFINNSANAS